MTTNIDPPESTLAALGFTEIEAAIYCELLRGAPSTGYRLAKGIGKAPANTYQALAALAAKGAVMVDDGDSRIYRATSPGEYLGRLRRGFDAQAREAETALEALQTLAADDRIYQLKSAAQLYERAEAMIAGAGQMLLFDLFPGPLARLEPALRQAHHRGVVVAGLVYGPTPDLPFRVATARSSDVIAERWPGLQLTVVADACEHLAALLALDGQAVRHGVWSDSVYLACLKHSELAAEIQLSAARPEPDAPFGDLALLRAYPPGLTRLIGPQAPRQA